MTPHTMNWTGSSFGNVPDSSTRGLEEPELPSSFVMEDGTDWDSHIGSIFGNQLPRRVSSIDFSMSGYAQDDFLAAHHTVTSNEALGCSDDTLMCTPHQDEITLQDVIDADDQEPLLNDHDDTWRSVRTGGGFQNYPHLPIHANPPHPEHEENGRRQREVSESFEVVESADPCYARLLWKCLRDAPDHTLSLKDIYSWIRQHTQKARDPKNKGWQNSVRHNLSMNAAFERVASGNNNGSEGKKGSLWRLTEHAVESGVISTTRYRRDPKRKPERRGLPALKRQLSGAKGGAATRAASHYKRLREARDARERLGLFMPAHMQRHYTTTPESTSATPLPTYMNTYPSEQPLGPYFVNGAMTSPTIMQSSACSSPYTPPTMQFASNFHEEKGGLRNFEMCHLEYNTGLFNNVDINRPYTPSLLTESSFYTDDAVNVHAGDPIMARLATP